MTKIEIKSETSKKHIKSDAKYSIAHFVEDLPVGLEHFWPLDFTKEGYNTEYIEAISTHKQAGFIKSLKIQAEITNDNSHYVVAVDFDYDGECLDINLESLYKEKGKNGNKFTAQLIEKFKSFAIENDKLQGNTNTQVSTVKIHAKSGYHKKSEKNLWGGYVWANHGFDFDKNFFAEELSNMQKCFKSFITEKAAVFEDKDLKKFTKPCHFAAFDCGIKLENEEGKSVHIGKEFMATQSWHGVWRSNDKNSVQEKYAKEYNDFEKTIATRRKNALMILGENYVRMLKKYAKQNNQDEKQIKRDEDIVRNKKFFADKLKLVRAKLKKVISR